MCRLVCIVICCVTLFIGAHSNCHPRVYEYDDKTGVKKGKDPVEYSVYKKRELDCRSLAKDKCAPSLHCLWREEGSVWPIEAPSIMKLTAVLLKVMTKQDIAKAKETGIKTIPEQRVQTLKPGKSVVTVGTDGILYDMEYTSFQELLSEKKFDLVHPEVVTELHHAVKVLVDLFTAQLKQKPTEENLKVEVVSEFEKGLKQDTKVTSNELKHYPEDYWAQYLQFVEDHQKVKSKNTPQQGQVEVKKGKSKSKSTRKLLAFNAVQGNARQNNAPYSSFGLIGAFDQNNDYLDSGAGGFIVKSYYGYDHGRVLWVYVVAAAHDIIYPYYTNIDIDPIQAIFLKQSLDKFKFYPGFSGDDAARKNINVDGWELKHVFILPAYEKAYIEQERAGDTASDIAVFQFMVRGRNHIRAYTKPNPMAQLFVRNQVPANMHMAGYDITVVHHENQQPDTYTYIMKESAIAGVDCTKNNGESCYYGGQNGMALKPGYCGGTIFDTGNPERVVAVQSSIGNPPQNGNCGPYGGPNCEGRATKITAGKKQGVDWVVGDVVAPERINMLLDVTHLQLNPRLSRTEYHNMMFKEEYDDADEAYQYDHAFNAYQPQHYGVNGDNGMNWIMFIYGIIGIVLMLMVCCLMLFGCCSAGGITGYFVNYVLSFKKKEEEDVYNNFEQSDV